MRSVFKAALIAFALSGALAAPVIAGPLEDGLAAATRGDYATALQLFRPLAEQGNATAQHNLGHMYEMGLGVTRDYVLALMWYTLAAARGNTFAQKNRDANVKKMTPAQIAEAQKLAREWKIK